MLLRFLKFNLLVFLCAASFLRAAAQQPANPFQNLINVGTKSPEAANLGKFGNIPVGYNTGVPGISVPIYNIVAGQLSLPVSLDYHSGGIRIDETSSSVGMGWALSGFGVISRTMLGRPDDEGYIGSPAPQAVISTPESNFTFIRDVSNGVQDAQPDIFQYSVNGISGKFIFRRDGSILQIPLTSNKIIFAAGNFTIIDPEGNKYFFEEKRVSYSSNDNISQYVTSWCITKALAANGEDEILFSYESTQYLTFDHPVNFTYSFGYTLSCEIESIGGGVLQSSTPVMGVNQRTQTITHAEYYPKEINWKNGRITFENVRDREDITGDGLRLNLINIYGRQDGLYRIIQKIKLNQSYFFSNAGGGTVTEKNRRLKLDNVEFLDKNGLGNGQVYKMDYNNSPIAPRESYAQDRWGFNNGHYENGDLIPQQTYNHQGAYYNFGNANRDADAVSMLAGTISSIQYPTKGKTVFEFEPHRYHTNLPVTSTKTIFQGLCCGTSSSTQVSFTVNAFSGNFRYNAFISKFNYPDVTDRPRIKLTDQATGQVIFEATTIPTTATNTDYTTGTLGLNLLQGHSYLLAVNTYTSNPLVSANVTITYNETIPNVPDIKIGGGLRIKSLTNYDINGGFIGKEIYAYGDDNTGELLTPQYYQDINFEKVVHRNGCISPAFGCTYALEPSPGYTTIFHANSILPTSQYSGSPVVYRKVTKFQVDADGHDNGKTIYKYGIYADGATTPFVTVSQMSYVFDQKSGIYLVSNVWKNGNLEAEEGYKRKISGYQILYRKTNSYTDAYGVTENLLKVIANYAHSGCEAPVASAVQVDYGLTLAPITTGIRLLNAVEEVSFDDNGNSTIQTRNFTYNPQQLLPSKIETTNSKNQVVTQHIKYPVDFSNTGNVYEKMVNRNIVNVTVQNQELVNNSQTKLVKINYADWFNNTKLLLPVSTEQQIASNPIETRLYFNRFDKYGNVLEQQKTNDMKEAYLYGYNSQYPVAKISNSTYAIASSKVTQSVLDNPADDASLRIHLDNLRTIPDAMVTTYTYAPLIGITSETDPTGKTTFYEYDAFNRLKNIKDYKGNIIKNFRYNYAGACGNNCVVLQVQTFTGYDTPGYPVGVFNSNKEYIGIANTADEYVTLWNSNAAKKALGVLSPGTTSMRFNLSLTAGATAPPVLFGLRYYQWDVFSPTTVSTTTDMLSFIDWGDGSRQLVTQARTQMTEAMIYGYAGVPVRNDFMFYTVRLSHLYANSQPHTITVFHNETTEAVGINSLGISTVQNANIRGNYPEKVKGIHYNNIVNSSDQGVVNFNALTDVLSIHYQLDITATGNNGKWQTINHFHKLKWIKLLCNYGNELATDLRVNFPDLVYLELQGSKPDVNQTWGAGGFKNLYIYANGLQTGAYTTAEIDLILNSQSAANTITKGMLGFAPVPLRSVASTAAYNALIARNWILQITNP